ncbi:transcription initiation factor TFIID subunit 7-like [Hydractinia symbiolongicarpus]|uniref:transcription initiation factor TFIID subunit 7-like n=1 Tax=Hydractinia symbiolongicarpus TaxID=13093 RepID=UPI00254BFB3A|nr:transcription initiation factor TFIID subunit 7-like [Hydractinia symbiolongicarpus]
MSGSSKAKSKNKEGKTKSSKSDADKFTELEHQLILRLPEPYAATLDHALQNGGLKDRLQIEFEDNVRNASVKFDDVLFRAKLYDLPTITESWKTFDKKSLWKTGDICQILICKDPESVEISSDEEETSFDYLKKQLHQAKKYQYPHGLTPPLKNVRKRRFRKTAKQKYVDAPEIEKEVKRLLRADVSAVDVKFEIVNDELEKQKQEEQEDEIDVGGPSIEQFDEHSNMSSVLGSDNEGGQNEADILPDISSSEDEDSTPKSTKDSHHSGHSRLKHAECEKRIKELKTKQLEQEMKIANAANPFLKQRFQTVLDEMKKEEEQLLGELDGINLSPK